MIGQINNKISVIWKSWVEISSSTPVSRAMGRCWSVGALGTPGRELLADSLKRMPDMSP